MNKKDDLFTKKHLVQDNETLALLKNTDRKQKKQIDIISLAENKYYQALLMAFLIEKNLIDINDQDAMIAAEINYSKVTSENAYIHRAFIERIAGHETCDDPTRELNLADAISYMKNVEEGQ